MKIAGIILAIVVALVIVLVGLKTDLLRESNNLNAPYSFSKFQLWLWSLVIIPLFVIRWGMEDKVDPNETFLVLLGISSATLVTASAISATQKSKAILTKTPLKALSVVSAGFIADILSNDTGQISVVRLQQFVFTIIYIVIFFFHFFQNDHTYPCFGHNAYILMGISAGSYATGKALNQ